MVSAEKLGNLRLLVSELVTNAFQHTDLDPDERIGLHVWAGDPLIRVEVHARGPGFEEPLSAGVPSPELPGGWGLYLVDTLSDRWGVDRDGDLTIVWSEVADGEA